MYERILRFLGSIKLAVPLLTVIIGILIWGTFYEAKVGSATVQYEVYKSPWFGALMFLLALNLAVAALSRYPWRGARKIGFAIAHLGIIVIIAGSAAVIHLGVEGLIPLRTDSGLNNEIRVEGDFLEVMDPQGKISQADLFIKPNGSVNVNQVGGLSLIGYTNNAIETTKFVETGGANNLAVRLSFHSDNMGQNLETWLAQAPEEYHKVGIGPAELELVTVANETELEAALSPPVEENPYPWGQLKITSSEGEIGDIPVKENLAQNLTLEDNIQIKIINFWPDFQIDENRQPITLSPLVRNPVIQLEIEAPEGRERMFLFGRGNFAPIRYLVSGEAISSLQLNYEVQLQPTEDYFRVITTPTGELYYAAHSSKGFKSGSLEIGTPTSPGWADFQITLEEVIPHSQPQPQVVPVNNPQTSRQGAKAQRDAITPQLPDSTVSSPSFAVFASLRDQIQGIPALLVKTEEKTKTWLPWGEAKTIPTPEGEAFAAFGPKLIQLPFQIALEDFIIDRNEGDDSIAMWTSKIRIEDPEQGIVTQRNVWMNHPTWYGGWKIAQASWDPNDLQQSTLQVKREPVWVTSLTWSGSALIVLGLIIMFYGPSLTKSSTMTVDQ